MTRKQLSHRGFILGFAVFFAITLTARVAQGQAYNVLYSFSGGIDGSEPMGKLVQDTAGNLYGTTRNGGTQGLGVAFQLTTSGAEKVLHHFVGGNDGATVQSGLIFDSASNLYGTTDLGGAQNHGVVFKIDSSGNESIVHTFVGGADGIGAPSPLIRDGAGNLFGVTYYGGNGPCDFDGNTGCGTIFKIDSSGNESVVYNFTGGADGNPDTALVEDTAGNLYGAARDGEVFELTSTGAEKSLHVLGGADGSDLRGDLIQDSAGNSYGTAFFGGASGKGVVFKLDTSGNETVLYNFSGGADGANPQSGVVVDGAGNFYGTTYNGGMNGFGTVFEIDSSGNESVLYSFAGGTDGANPYGGLFQDGMGNLYGTTYGGGASGHGTVFEIALMPPPSNLSAVVGNQSVLLQWTASAENSQGYNIYVDQIDGNARIGHANTTTSLGLLNTGGPIQESDLAITQLPGAIGPPQNGQQYRFMVTTVYTAGESGPSGILATPLPPSSPPHPYHPILFLHGIDSSAATWKDTTSFLSNTLNWACGGTLSYGPNDSPAAGDKPQPYGCGPNQPFSKSGDYFTVNFGNNLANYPDKRGIEHQGDEVGGFIEYLDAKSELSIVAHSMGGLAARSYMQISDPASAPSRITDLITLGTPHWGVDTTSLDTAAAEALTYVKIVGPVAESMVLSLFPDKLEALGSQGLQDMNGACVANGDSTDLSVLSPFLQKLDYHPKYGLPSGPRYVVVSGTGVYGYILFFPPLVFVPDPCVYFPLKFVETDLVVPDVSSTLSGILPSPLWSALPTNDNHLMFTGDVSAILCALDPKCLLLKVMSPVDIQVTAPNGYSISNSATSMPGARYSTVTEASGHETAIVLIPFPQGGQYTITATPKPGAQPTDTFTILQIQNGVTTTIAQDMPIQNIPPAGFQTVVKNGTSTLNYSPENIDFGNVVVGRKGKKVVTLENMGSTKATIGLVSLTVTAGNPQDFSITRYCGAPLASGKRCTIAVHFNPQSLETGAATLNIPTDASQVPLQIPITATGVKR